MTIKPGFGVFLCVVVSASIVGTRFNTAAMAPGILICSILALLLMIVESEEPQKK